MIESTGSGYTKSIHKTGTVLITDGSGFILSSNMNQPDTASTIWLGMFGNGQPIATQEIIIQPVRKLIRRDLIKVLAR